MNEEIAEIDKEADVGDPDATFHAVRRDICASD